MHKIEILHILVKEKQSFKKYINITKKMLK